MKYNITENDKALLLQNCMNYKYKIVVKDNDNRIIDVLNNAEINSYSIDGENLERRTFSLSVNNLHDIQKYIQTCLLYNFVLYIGVKSLRTDEYIWYECGTFVSLDINTLYDATTNRAETAFADWFARLGGTRNGQIGGSPTITIPNKDADGNLVTVKDALINFLKSEGILKFIVEDIGEFYGIPANNPSGYEAYRTENPKWNKLHYDLEFNIGNTDGDVIKKFVDLYPNTQAYFDVYNHFCVGPIPSCTHNPVDLDNAFLQKILVSENSENVTYDISAIRNVTEVYGKILKIDRFSESCTTSENTYTITLDKYEAYLGYQYIAFTPDTANIENMQIQINSLPALPIYKEYTEISVEKETLKAGKVYVIRIFQNDEGSFAAYFLGEYQPHAVCVLTEDENDEHYTKSYFQEKYNCSNIILRVEKDSPFSVQKLGEILETKSGEDFDSIISDSIAIDNAVYYNRKSSSLNDTVSITTKLIPWLDVMCKVEYKKAQDNQVLQYLIKNITHNISGGTSTITMNRLYPLYYN